MHAHDLTVVWAGKKDVSIEAPAQVSHPQAEAVHHDREWLIQTGLPNSDSRVRGRQCNHTVARKLFCARLLKQNGVDSWNSHWFTMSSKRCDQTPLVTVY